MTRLTIVSETAKGRAFNAELIAELECDSLAPYPSKDRIDRPVFAVFAGTDAEMRPFVANLRCGKMAEDALSSSSFRKRVEFLRSASWRWALQRCADGTAVTVWLPELFTPDLGMVHDKRIEFVLLQPKSAIPQLSEQDSARVEEHLKRLKTKPFLASHAQMFAAFLEGRTRCPIIRTLEFQSQLLAALKNEDLARTIEPGERFLKGFGLEELGYAEPIMFSAPHDWFEKVVATEVAKYFDVVGAERRAA